MAGIAPSDFEGTDRFAIVRCLGEGSMGTVYEVIDRESNAHMALKLLRRPEAADIERFKREFRRLQDLEHPNLVSLGELVYDNGCWFFTMELIEGVTLVEWLQREEKVDYELVRDTTGQLARGLMALHAAAKVHRDIKPSNVMVADDGRVVLLDFGLAADLADPQRTENQVVGTVAYMAPEQAASGSIGIEADWYSVGVILYEVLTSRLPFEGSPIEVMMRKQRLTPPPPRTLVAGLPKDLDSLCADLLHFDPDKRPTGAEVLRRLGCEEVPEAQAIGALPFVGRRRELARLRQSFDEIAHGHPVTVIVEGESGVGKSALVRRFTRSLQSSAGNALVLEGRCYERESVSYKAFDGIVASLARYLEDLPRAELAELLPEHIGLLGQIFPALRPVVAIGSRAGAQSIGAGATSPNGDSPAREPQSASALELRRRVFAALRELLIRVSSEHAVILAIDDLQWADRDSIALMAELLRPPGAPALMVLATFRPIEEHRDPVALSWPGRKEVIKLEGLPERDAEELVRRLMRRARLDGDAVAIAREGAGHPLFLGELVWRSGHDRGAGSQRRLEDVIAERVADLEPETKQLVEVLAVAGAPIAQEVAARAAGLDFAELSRRAAQLRAALLARTTGGRSGDRIELYHDRVTGAVCARMSSQRITGLHRALAESLEVAETLDPEGLCTHWLGAGDSTRAAQYAGMAAARAAESLAFERAARRYQLAIDLAAGDPDLRRRIYPHLAEALANAGRGPEAAEMYLEAAREAPTKRALELRTRAAEQFLFSGHVDRGLEGVRAVLTSVGLSYPRSPRSALASLLLRRTQLRLRGLRHKQRTESEIPRAELDRIDVCWSVSKSLGMVDTIRGADFQTRNLLMALSAGEPFRIARALAGECAFSAVAGGRSRRRTMKLLRATRELLTRVDNPYAVALFKMARGLVTNLNGRWLESHDQTVRAEQLFREQCTGVAWEIDTAQFFTLFSLMYMGELRELSRLLPVRLDDALSRGDLYAASGLRSRFGAVVALAADDPDQPRDEVRNMIARWSQSGFTMQHWWDLVVTCDICLYVNEGAEAWSRLEADWPALDASMLLRVQQIRVEAHFLRGRCALSRAVFDEPARARLLASAERDARRVERERMRWATPQARLLRAGVANLRGDPEAALAHLEHAANGFADATMPLHAAAAQRCIGVLLGGDQGDEIRGEAERWMTGQSIENPRRYTRMLAPGLPGAR